MKIATAIKYTVIYRAWLIASGAMLVLFAPVWFTPIEQGLYFTFASLVAAHVLFELGAGFVLTQYIAHEHGAIKKESGYLDKLNENFRLKSIYGYTKFWFRLSTIFFTIFIGAGGFWFFSTKVESSNIDWLNPWLLLVVSSACNLYMQPHLIVMEGLGKVGLVSKIRTQQSIIGNLIMWGFLFNGYGLYAIFILPLVSGVTTYLYSRADKDLLSISKGGKPATLFKEIFPMQSKIALSWASGYFVFHAITPIIFSKIGMVEAGKFGLGLAALNGVQSIGTAWINVRGPQFANYIARKKYYALRVNFIRSFRMTIAMSLTGVGLVWLGIIFMDTYVLNLALRFPSIEAMIPLGINGAVNTIIFCLALYMRSHKQEPLLVSSFFCAILSVVSVYLASGFGFNEVCWAYALVTILIGLPWTYAIFRKFNH
jgi:hypothetical protein